MTGPGFQAYLIVSALLFGIGVAAVLSQRSALMVLMAIEILLNSAVLAIVAVWRFIAPAQLDGQVLVFVAITIGAVEMAAGLGLILLVFRQRRTTNVDTATELRG